MKHVGVVLGGLVSSLVLACGSTPPPDPGTGGPTVQTMCSASDTNPYGTCYPTQNIGTSVRAGSTPGSIIANFAFDGLPAADTGKLDPAAAKTSTSTIHLSNYYDPAGKGIPGVIGGVPIKIIHLTVAALWCGPCNEETDFIAGANHTGYNTGNASFATELAPLGVVFVQAIDDGPVPGTGATLNDLSTWITWHSNDFTTMVDPGNANLGIFFNAAAIPFNMNINAKTMEILTADVGFDTQMDTTIKALLNTL
jgi:hypothetical protein